MHVVLPGDAIPIEPTQNHVKLGPGLIEGESETIISTKAGIMRQSESGHFWIEHSQKRYIPSTGESVIGVVVGRTAESYRVDFGGPHNATLPHLAFEGATKRNRPHLDMGTLVYCHVTLAHPDMEPELTCVNPSTQKAETYGELKEGYLIKTSLGLSRSLLDPKCEVLMALGSLLPYEICVGMNGRIWINTDSVKSTVAVISAIRNSEFIADKKEIRAMVRGLMKSMNDSMDTSV